MTAALNLSGIIITRIIEVLYTLQRRSHFSFIHLCLLSKGRRLLVDIGLVQMNTKLLRQ